MTAKPPVRFTEVPAIRFHHKPVHVAAFVTCAQTVPQLFLGIDHQARFVVIMEGTETYELLAALRECDAPAANERHQLIRLLHPPDLTFVDQHPFQKSCQEAFAKKALAKTGWWY